MANIVFLLPGEDTCPVGGFKVCYEYANRFVNDGFNVTIVYPEFCGYPRKPSAFYWVLKYVKHKLLYIKKTICRTQISGPTWFSLDPRVKKEYVWKISRSKTFKDKNTKHIATALPTSFELAKKIKKSEQKGFYFIQGFEAWGNQTTEQVYESYRLPLEKIAIAPWLVKCIESVGATAVVVENGLWFDYFNMTNPIENRSRYEVAMLYHPYEVKRCSDAWAALKLVKEKIPELHVTMFGIYERPDVPEWFSYFKSPNKEIHNKIYNTAAVFVAPSRIEGMGLTPAESMVCGCAVACTDNPGFAMFSRPDKTTLVSKACDIESLASNILKLIQNDELRIQIAKNGQEFIQQFTWERAYKLFKAALQI